MSHPARGPRNLLTDVAGLSVGQAEDPHVRTGVTVILGERLTAAACDVSGGGPGTRETDALAPESVVRALDALVFAGGSAYGLGAADAVAAVLGASGRGYRPRDGADVPPTPLVGAAILYDLANGGDKAWGEAPPFAELGRAALAAAGADFALGSHGAGHGAQAGTLKGGVGSASAVTRDGLTVGALAAVNAFGSVVGPDGSAFWAAPFELDHEFGGTDPAELWAEPDSWPHAKHAPAPGQNTTLCCVGTDADLTSVELKRVAVMARAGLAHAIRPVFTPFDGDVIFALSTGRRAAPEPRNLTVARLGALAADTLARAIARGVFEAQTWPGSAVPDWRAANASPEGLQDEPGDPPA